jgi:exodeoxyribonuclease-3
VKLVTWNVNSIRARLDRLIDFVKTRAPDVLCLQETKVADDGFPALELRALGYDLAFHGQRTYNGVAILSRMPLADVTRGFGDGDGAGAAHRGDERRRPVAGLRAEQEAIGPSTLQARWMERLRRHVTLGGDARRTLRRLQRRARARGRPRPEGVEGHVLFRRRTRRAGAHGRPTDLVDLIRTLHPDEPMFTWWDYRMLAFPKGRGLRIDHLLVTPALAARVTACGVDRESRKGKQPSDHAAVWMEFRDV